MTKIEHYEIYKERYTQNTNNPIYGCLGKETY